MDTVSAIRFLASPLDIGDVSVPNRVFLAPMSGVTDRPFRDIAASMGAGLVVSEMVASEQFVRGQAQAKMRAERCSTGAFVIQLAGREERWMAEGAKAAADAGADIIDINMGCPARKVTNGYSGSALMRDLDHAVRLIEATVRSTSIPVTLKMRLGWDDQTINAPELARRAESAGVRLITVHGRTRCQFYTGAADWKAIRAVKQAVSVPVIANGDITSPEHLATMLEQSGADGVMIGRGAYGRPWFPGKIAEFAATGRQGSAPCGSRLLSIVITHYEAMIAQYGEEIGVRHARKHLGWYLDRTHASAVDMRSAILTETRPAKVIALLHDRFGTAYDRKAA